MNKPKPDYWMAEAGTPPNVKPLIGRKVIEAYLLPSLQTILLIFETPTGKMTLIAESMTVNGTFILQLEVGEVKPGARFDDVEELDSQPHLVGLEFTEVDCDVLVFGDFGVQVPLGEPIRWVKKKA